MQSRLFLIQNHLKSIDKPIPSPQTPDPQSKYHESSVIFNGFYKKPFKERLNQLSRMDPDLNVQHFETGGLSLSRAELMVENCIGKVSIPLGLGLNFLINGKYYTVPMCVEEPSVIAAASSGAKFIAENGGGFKTLSTPSIMIGQMQILDCNLLTAKFRIEQVKTELIEKGNKFLVNMVQRGGGLVDIRTKILKDQDGEMMILEFLVNVCESMGANIVNTLVENMSQIIQEITEGRIGIRILSNLCTERRAISRFSIPLANMKYKDHSGEVVARRILEAYKFAQLDPYRATTHNKGIMNGIDAVALATGQDWRALEASAHAYSYLKFGKYQPLSHFEVSIDPQTGEKVFNGVLELPLSVGVKGGVLASNSLYHNSLRLLDFPSAQTLSEIIVTVGLSQNFAALRALAIEGIQKGHMALHARNIAMAAGTPTYLVEDVVNYMRTFHRISLDSAKIYLEAHELFTNLRKKEEKKRQIPLSTFYVKIKPISALEPIVVHIAFDCWTEKPLHYSIEKKAHVNKIASISNRVFGQHDYEWLETLFNFLAKLRDRKVVSENILKIELLGILLNIISFNLAKNEGKFREKARFLYQNIQQESHSNQLFDAKELLSSESIELKYGLSLFCELHRIFCYSVNTLSLPSRVQSRLLAQMKQIIESNFHCCELWSQRLEDRDFEQFLLNRKKRLSATFILLCNHCQNIEFSENKLDLMEEIGCIVELISITGHDLVKRKEGEPNAFEYWKGKKGNEDKSEFLKEIKRVISRKTMGFRELKKGENNQEIQEIMKNVGEVLKSYYKFEEFEEMKVEALRKGPGL